MIQFRQHRQGALFGRSLQSYLLNGALRVFVKPQFRQEGKPAAEMREFMQKYIEGRATFPPHHRHWQDDLGGVPNHWFRANTGESRGALLYLHGGAFMVETPRAHAAFVCELAGRSGLLAAMPSYRLAPEYPFPAAVEDVMACYKGLLALGIDPAEIVVAGDSAGGNLTLVLLQQLKRQGVPLPAAGLMISPGMDLSGRLRSHHINTYSDPMFNQYAMQQVITNYLQDDVSLLRDERVSPLRGDFDGLPPLFFLASSIEIFRDCSIYATRKADASGVDVRCHIWKGVPHCFPIMFGNMLPEAARATDDMVEFLLDTLSKDAAAPGGSQGTQGSDAA